MKAQKYNFKTREYEPVEIPDGASMIEYDMDNEIECADCGTHLKFGDSYTSRRIHNDVGFAYMVCPECYSKEWKEQ